MNTFGRLGSLSFMLGWTLLLALPVGCGEGDGDDDESGEEEGDSLMKPGEPCLGCHSEGSDNEASEEPFTAAGTVFTGADGTTGVEGVTVTLVGADDNQVSTTTNSAGNFYTEGTLAFPVTVTLDDGTDTISMASGAAQGDCNSCHGAGSAIHFP